MRQVGTTRPAAIPAGAIITYSCCFNQKACPFFFKKWDSARCKLISTTGQEFHAQSDCSIGWVVDDSLEPGVNEYGEVAP